MGHSNIRSTMEYIHVAKQELSVENPLDAFMKGEKQEMTKIQEILERGLEEYLEKNKTVCNLK